MNVAKELESWLKTDPPKVSVIPRRNDVLIQLFTVDEESPLYTGVKIDHTGLLVGKARKGVLHTYPIARVLRSSADEYKEGDVVYLDDMILYSERNEAYDKWFENQKHSRPLIRTVAPPEYVGGLEYIERYTFKTDKLDNKNVDDDFLYQVPLVMIKGIYEV